MSIRTSSSVQKKRSASLPFERPGELQASAIDNASKKLPSEERCQLTREMLCGRLRETQTLEHSDPRFMHGRAYFGPLHPPRETWHCKLKPRDEHDTEAWLTASEFEDQSAVAAAKIGQLAAMLRMSKRTVVYTGAGISASVVGQAARSGENIVGFKIAPKAAKPTFTHHALTLLFRQGLIHSWVQQNHDGLPQKAGFPQEHINEVHGSWYDPSNPVVKYGGSCSPHFENWMQQEAEGADLVLVLGTSLGGLFADRVATKTAERSKWLPTPISGCPEVGARVEAKPPGFSVELEAVVVGKDSESLTVQFDKAGKFPEPIKLPLDDSSIKLLPTGGLGSVCINLQQTPRDDCFTLRLFNKSDDAMRLLLQELQIPLPKCCPQTLYTRNRVLVPYDSNGDRLPDGAGKWMWLDLSDGQKVCLTSRHNIQSAKQPAFMHIGASQPITQKGFTRQPGEGHGVVVCRHEATSAFLLQIDGVEMALGIWWLEAAARGAVEFLPMFNRQPQFDDAPVVRPKTT